MSASLNNAGLELIAEGASSVPENPEQNSSQTETPGREALQALLAFSALHEQIRNRRAKQLRDGVLAHDDWRLEQFVLDEVLQLVAERALAITGADGVAVALAEGDAIICRASAGSIAPDAGVRLDPNAGFSGECLVSGRIVRCDDVEADSRVDLPACRRLGVRSLLAVPLSAKQSVIGLLEAFSNEPYGFNDSDVRSLSLLSELVLSALRPEEEDRLAEISQRVVGEAAVEVQPVPEIAPAVTETQTEPPVEQSEAPVLADTSPATETVAQQELKPVELPVDIAEDKTIRHARPGLAVVVAVVLLAIGSGAGVWWVLGHRPGLVKANSSPSAPMAAQRSVPVAAAPSQPTAPLTPAQAVTEDDSDMTAPSEETGVLPQVTGVRHWSSSDSSTVVIDLQDQVQYEAHRLPRPERIYFDLHDTKLDAALANRIITIDDALLQRVRIAQPMAGVTRVVLETKSASDFSVSMESNPYRLVIEVRKVGTRPNERAKIDLFAPGNSTPSDHTAAAPPTAKSPQADQVAKVAIPDSPSAIPGKDGKHPVASSKPVDTAQTQTRALPPKLRIVLDAGHGGWDLGGVGRSGLYEKDLVLDIVERLGQMVGSRLGAEVVYTRKDDSYLALEKRAEIANVAQANLFVSVHANYSDFPSARGVETYYTNTYSSVKARTEDADDASAAGLKTIDWTNVDIRAKVHESRKVAASVQRSLYATLAAKSPGLRNRGVKEAHYVVLTGTSMPAILAEVSFVSSPTDENNLQSSTYRQQIAEALYNGIARYQASNREVKMASASAKPSGK